ncbi:MAG: hypothetical protein ABW046_20520 [Actinoplanes sp.]
MTSIARVEDIQADNVPSEVAAALHMHRTMEFDGVLVAGNAARGAGELCAVFVADAVQVDLPSAGPTTIPAGAYLIRTAAMDEDGGAVLSAVVAVPTETAEQLFDAYEQVIDQAE